VGARDLDGPFHRKDERKGDRVRGTPQVLPMHRSDCTRQQARAIPRPQPCTLEVQALGQERACVPEWTGTKTARAANMLEAEVLQQHVKYLVVTCFTVFLN